jgi:hypothetical protein
LFTGFPGNFGALFGGELIGSRPTALSSAKFTECNSGWIAPIFDTVIGLPCGYVAYEFGERNRIARAFLAGFCHDDIIA